jgi:hypothetical protein
MSLRGIRIDFRAFVSDNEENHIVTATEITGETAPPSEKINDLVHEAMLSYERVLKEGIQLQEESVNLWRDLLAKADSLEELRGRLGMLSTDVFPSVRKQLEEFVESSSLSLMLVNRSSGQLLDLLGKSLGIYRATSIAEAQQCIRDLLDGSLAALRENVPVLVAANAKIISTWKGLADLNPVKNASANAQNLPPKHVA